MLFNKKILLDNNEHFYVGFEFYSISYYKLEGEKGDSQFVFNGKLVLTGSDGVKFDKGIFGFYFTFSLDGDKEHCEISSSDFCDVSPYTEKFKEPVKRFLNSDLPGVKYLFLDLIENSRKYVNKSISFLNGHNEKILSSKFEEFKKDVLYTSDEGSENKIKCSFLIEKDVRFIANYDFEFEFFEDSYIEFKLNGENKFLILENKIPVPFNNLTQIIKFQSLFIDFK